MSICIYSTHQNKVHYYLIYDQIIYSKPYNLSHKLKFNNVAYNQYSLTLLVSLNPLFAIYNVYHLL